MVANNHIQNIALVGAAGQVGKFIAEALLAKNMFTITALTRKDSNNKPAPGIHVAHIDYAQSETLVDALKGQDVLIITMSVHAPSEHNAALIKAAAKAGVPWVLPNEFGGDDNEEVGRDVMIGVTKKKDRDLIESLGVSSWIGICTGFWYEYSLAGPGLFGIDIGKREVIWFDEGAQRINTSTWPQVGRAVAQVLALPVEAEAGGQAGVTLSSYRNRFVRAASFALNQREMFESVKRVTGTTDEHWKFSSTTAKQHFAEGREKLMGGDRMGFAQLLYARAFFLGENAALPEVTHGLDNEKLGLPKEDLDGATMESVKLVESGYFAKLFGSG